MKRGLIFLTVLAVAATLLAGCALPGAPTPGPTAQPTSLGSSTGTLTVFVTDAPPEYTVTSVMVHFSEVWVHKAADEEGGEGEWIQLTITGGTFGHGSFDLAELRDDEAKVELAAEELAAGKYTQIRVIMDEEEGVQVDYNDPDGNPHEDVTAKLPSGKLKFVHPFEVAENGETEILLDFDLEKSVVFTGASQSDEVKIIVKPVVKLSVSEKGKPAELEATLESDTEAEAELSTEIKHTGRDSAHLKTTGTEEPGDEARIVIPLPEGTTLGKVESISWWTYLVDGYVPHVDLVLDYDGDASRDDVLVAEAAHQNDNDAIIWKDSYKGEDVGWIETFEGASSVYTSWAMSGNCGDVKSVNGETAVWMVAANNPNFGLDTLANFQTTIGKTDGSITINEETAVLALEIEIDNWIYQSEAYVDDIDVIIDGITYKVRL